MEGFNMVVRYTKEFANLQQVSLENRERCGKIIQAILKWNLVEREKALTLVHPKLSPAVPTQWGELKAKLSDKTLKEIKVYNDPKDNKRPCDGLPWRVELCRDDQTIGIINCRNIEGLN